MTQGLVIGKFYPPHIGHSRLIRHALSLCDRVVVLVCDKPGQVIPAQVRAGWLKLIFPEADVQVIADIMNDEDSVAWANHTRAFLGFEPDYVFTGGEAYGKPYAHLLHAKHISIKRNTSATKIRTDVLRYLDELEAPVRAGIVPRVVVLGAESTGTTTLAKDLAQHYQTFWVPEYGRVYSEAKLFSSTNWTSQEFIHIAQVQIQMEDKFAEQANQILICDTDPFATTLWHERYLGAQLEQLEAIARSRTYALYLVTDVKGVPFFQDGLRDGEHIRHKMHDMFVQKLRDHNLPFHIVTGSQTDRVKQAIDLIDQVLESFLSFFSGPS